MKPHRLALTHSLVLHYGLYKKMIVSLVASAGDGGWGRAAALGIGRLAALNAPRATHLQRGEGGIEGTRWTPVCRVLVGASMSLMGVPFSL